jgi:hypothetical protein
MDTLLMHLATKNLIKFDLDRFSESSVTEDSNNNFSFQLNMSCCDWTAKQKPLRNEHDPNVYHSRSDKF